MQEATEAAAPEAATPDAALPATPPPIDDAAFARIRREADEAKREAQAAREALAERERKEAEEAGKYKELYEAQQAENESLKSKQAAAEQRRLAERAAGDLKFRDSGYAIYLLEQERIDFSDAVAVKARLSEIAATRTDLVSAAVPPLPSGGPAGGPTNDSLKLTREQLAGMSPQQIAALDPKVLNEALAG